MDRTRRELLARPGLTQDQYSRAGLREARQLVAGPADLGALADDQIPRTLRGAAELREGARDQVLGGHG